MRRHARRQPSLEEVAGRVGKLKAHRAVGTALARNRLAVLSPCHRVLREAGEVGQYRWGTERKVALLAWEQATRWNGADVD